MDNKSNSFDEFYNDYLMKCKKLGIIKDVNNIPSELKHISDETKQMTDIYAKYINESFIDLKKELNKIDKNEVDDFVVNPNNNNEVDIENLKSMLRDPDLFDTDEEKAKAFLRSIINGCEKLVEQGYKQFEFKISYEAYYHLKTILNMLENNR
ncbi:hypothetical protein [Eubacterium sp.]|uniref:hypothetical protein n=1 Tax=Eubacterium sp. TaxID=142586 RepID=UPI0025D85045|nr:hypothetical protein [Eubacterium sp.]MCR5630108.1 hypothetical protein [Eubacterium sp.]